MAGRNAGAAPPSPAIDCNDKNAVVSAIYDRFKNDPVLKDQISHINVDFRNGVVTLRGYAFRPKGAKSPKAGVNLAGKLAREATDCESKVNNQLVTFKIIGCPPGMKSCGSEGVCVPQGEGCNIPSMQ